MMNPRRIPLLAAVLGVWALAQAAPAQAANTIHQERFHALLTKHHTGGNSVAQFNSGLLLTQHQIDRFARSFERQFNKLKKFAIIGIPQSQILTAENDYVAGLQQAQAQLRSDLASFPRSDFADRQAAVQNYLLNVNGLQFNFWNEVFFGATPSA